MENLLDINPGLLIWTLISFGLLLFILGKFAFPGIIGSLQEREQGIQKNIDEAKKANEEAKALVAQTQEQVNNAYKEVSQIIANGRKQADDIINKANAEADHVKRTKLEEAVKEIEQSKQNAINQIRNEVAGLIVEATEKILEQKLDKENHVKLIESYVNKLHSN